MKYVEVPYKQKRTVYIFVTIVMGQHKIKFSSMDNSIQDKFECTRMANHIVLFATKPKCGV